MAQIRLLLIVVIMVVKDVGKEHFVTNVKQDIFYQGENAYKNQIVFLGLQRNQIKMMMLNYHLLMLRNWKMV